MKIFYKNNYHFPYFNIGSGTGTFRHICRNQPCGTGKTADYIICGSGIEYGIDQL